MGNSIWEMMTAGGPIMFILAGLSVLSLTVIMAKVLQLWAVVSGGSRREAAIDGLIPPVPFFQTH